MSEKILDIAQKAGLHVNSDGEIGPAFFGSVDAGYKRFASLIINECLNEIHAVNMGNLTGQSYYLDRVAQHIETHFGYKD